MLLNTQNDYVDLKFRKKGYFEGPNIINDLGHTLGTDQNNRI